MWTPDRRSYFDDRGNWRQTLDPFDAHVVDHGGCLWIWQPESTGYRFEVWFATTNDEPIFYNLEGLYDD